MIRLEMQRGRGGSVMSEKWIYLVRHGKPEFPEGKTVCLGSAELPLSGLGRMQSVLAGFALKEKLLPAGNAQEGETPSREEQVPISVFSSTLGRAEETADWLIASWPEGSFRLQRVEEFRETDNGEWDGLTFETIRERYPALYEARGENPDLLTFTCGFSVPAGLHEGVSPSEHQFGGAEIVSIEGLRIKEWRILLRGPHCFHICDDAVGMLYGGAG